MPSRWLIELELSDLQEYSARDFYGLVAGWLDGHRTTGEHRAARKPWSCSPLRDHGNGLLSIEIGVLADVDEAALVERLRDASARPIRIGSHYGQARSPRLLGRACWPDLSAAARPVRAFTFQFETPTGFRRGKQPDVLPTPQRIFGHYRRVWREFASIPEPDARFTDFSFTVTQLTLESVVVPLGRDTFTGVVGTLTITIDRPAPGLHALARLAPFSGTGARTTHGMGVTSVQFGP